MFSGGQLGRVCEARGTVFSHLCLRSTTIVIYMGTVVCDLLFGTHICLCYLDRRVKTTASRPALLSLMYCGCEWIRRTRDALRRFLFLFEFTSPPHVRSGPQIFCETKFRTGGKKKKNVPRSFFPAKMGLNSGEPSTRAHTLSRANIHNNRVFISS